MEIVKVNKSLSKSELIKAAVDMAENLLQIKRFNDDIKSLKEEIKTLEKQNEALLEMRETEVQIVEVECVVSIDEKKMLRIFKDSKGKVVKKVKIEGSYQKRVDEGVVNGTSSDDLIDQNASPKEAV